MEISGEPKQCSARPHRALNMCKKLYFSKKYNLPQRLELTSHWFGTVCTLVLNKMNWNKSSQNIKVQLYLDITSLKINFKPNEHYKRREREREREKVGRRDIALFLKFCITTNETETFYDNNCRRHAVIVLHISLRGI